MMRWLCVAGLFVVMAACGKEVPPRPRGLLGPDGKPLSTAAPPPAPEKPKAETKRRPGPQITRVGSSSRSKPASGSVDMGRSAAPSQAARPTTPDGAGSKRSSLPGMTLKKASVRLGQMIGEPRRCLDLDKVADEMGGKITIRTSASVMASGRIMRATASVPGHDQEAADCVSQLVINKNLGEVQGAPITVTAEVQVVVKRTPASKAAAE